MKVDPGCLPWSVRFPTIVATIKRFVPDVLAVEELNHHRELAAALPEYDSLFLEKKGGPATAVGAPPDGIGLFVRRAVFSIVGSKASVFEPPVPRCSQGYVAAALRCVHPGEDEGRMVIVAASHLKGALVLEREALPGGEGGGSAVQRSAWAMQHMDMCQTCREVFMYGQVVRRCGFMAVAAKHGFEDLRVAQAQAVLREIQGLRSRTAGALGAAAIFLGDFNRCRVFVMGALPLCRFVS